MDITTLLSADDLTRLTRQVENYNRGLNPAEAAGAGQSLGKDDFLRILLTQLTHQDPTSPLEDKEFVAQMAQFSTLEQMTNMSADLAKVFGIMARSQAIGLLGKTVQIAVGDSKVSGRVEEITGSEFPQILVEGRYYDVSQVLSVME
ncbi:MAG: flagellar hook assembly protein FlgD [Spirochaetales bacterium]|nr:flagellar hook assembly protein FlgD [Spirochaetales bacterium]